MDKKLIGQYLVADHKVSQSQVEKALEIQANSLQGGSTPLLGTVMVKLGMLHEQDVTDALKRQQNDRNTLHPS